MKALSLVIHRLCTKSLFFFIIAFFIGSGLMPEEVDAKRRGYSRSRSRSSSYRRSRSSSRRRSSTTRSRRRSKGGSIGRIFSSSTKPKSSVRPRSKSTQGASSYDTSRRRSVRSRPRRRRRPRYSNRGQWWSTPSSYKRMWRKTFRPKRRFRQSFYSRNRPILDVWDPYFLASAATTLFWYHHWDESEIQEALYTDHVLEDEDLKILETEVEAYHTQGVEKDPEYLPDGIGPQDAYSTNYLDRERRRRQEGGGGLIILVSILAGLGLGFKFLRG